MEAMDAARAYLLRVEALERAERLLQRHEAELAAREHLLDEKSTATGVKLPDKEWHQQGERIQSWASENSVTTHRGYVTMLKEWEDLILFLEKHASELRRKDVEVSERERDITRREASLRKERERLLNENQQLTQAHNSLATVRAAIEQRTHNLNLREAQLTRELEIQKEKQEYSKKKKDNSEKERYEHLMGALLELSERLTLLI